MFQLESAAVELQVTVFAEVSWHNERQAACRHAWTMQVLYIYKCHAHSAGAPFRASNTCRGARSAQGICGCPLLAALASCIILLSAQLSAQQVSSLHLLTQLSLTTGQVHHIEPEVVSRLVLAYVRTVYHNSQVLVLFVTVSYDTEHSYTSQHVVVAEPLA